MPVYDLVCEDGHEALDVVHSIHDPHPVCQTCGKAMKTLWATYNSGVEADSIRGGLDIRHGLCWPDGTPRRFYSVSEIRKAAAEAGLTIAGETPNPNPRLVEKAQRERESN